MIIVLLWKGTCEDPEALVEHTQLIPESLVNEPYW